MPEFMLKLFKYFAIGITLLILATGCANTSPKNKLIDDLKAKGFVFKEANGRIVMYLPDVYFEFGSAVLTQSANSSLLIICGVIKNLSAQPINIHVEGHTDSLGNERYNEKLSLQRANAVAEVLVSNGINKNQIMAYSYGSKRPIAPNTLQGNQDNPVGRAKNRRVEIGLEFKD